jgi:hypothetical protein
VPLPPGSCGISARWLHLLERVACRWLHSACQALARTHRMCRPHACAACTESHQYRPTAHPLNPLARPADPPGARDALGHGRPPVQRHLCCHQAAGCARGDGWRVRHHRCRESRPQRGSSSSSRVREEPRAAAVAALAGAHAHIRHSCLGASASLGERARRADWAADRVRRWAAFSGELSRHPCSRRHTPGWPTQWPCLTCCDAHRAYHDQSRACRSGRWARELSERWAASKAAVMAMIGCAV